MFVICASLAFPLAGKCTQRARQNVTAQGIDPARYKDRAA